eukprot:scaffold427_cov108-Isochrysis_galbana.AAC.1
MPGSSVGTMRRQRHPCCVRLPSEPGRNFPHSRLPPSRLPPSRLPPSRFAASRLPPRPLPPHPQRENHEPHLEPWCFCSRCCRSGNWIRLRAMSKRSGLHGTASSFGGKAMSGSSGRASKRSRRWRSGRGAAAGGGGPVAA